MRIQLVRHATLIVEIGDTRLLVGPMLSAKGAMAPVPNSPNPQPNPLVELPAAVPEILRDVGGVLVTHTHRDHWDDAAADILRKHLPLFCQPEDAAKFREQSFTDVRPVETSTWFQKIEISRTGGEHGTGEIGKQMAPVSGYV